MTHFRMGRLIRWQSNAGPGNGNGENNEGDGEPPPSGVPPSEEGRTGSLGPPPPVFRDLTGGGSSSEPPPPPYEAGRQGQGPERRLWPRVAGILVTLLVLFIVGNLLVGLYIDRLWFDEVGFRGVFNTRIGTQVWLFFAGFGIAFAFLLANFEFAWRTPLDTKAKETSPFREIALPSVRRASGIIGIVVAFFLAIIFGSIASSHWQEILQLMNAEPFGVTDPQFDRDAGFYVFQLEPLQFVKGWAVGLGLITVIGSVGVYGYRVLLHGGDATATLAVRMQLAVLLSIVIGLFVWGYWLARFELVVSQNGTVFGATYTDVNVRQIVYVLMMAVGGVTVLALLSWPFHRRLAVPGGALGFLALASVGGLLIYPAIVQQISVEPDELNRESEFIARNIQATRFAFGLDEIVEQPFGAEDTVTLADVEANPEALRNVRLWDHRPLNDTLSTIQSIRPLYVFPDVDVDRYTIGGESRQVFLSAREISHSQLEPTQQSWVNRRLQFTHGFGVTVSPVDTVTLPAGQPEFFVSNIPPVITNVPEEEQDALTITQPRIYFGEATGPWVIVNSDSEEFDFPTSAGGEDGDFSLAAQQRNRYDGEGGIELGGFFKRLAFAWEFGDTKILLSGSVQSDSRIMFRRNVQDRVAELAPFLQLDQDPYIVIGGDGGLYWIQDAYTTSDRFPYSQPHLSGTNYIRNSVKAVVDAYNGTVNFYIVDDNDPVIRVWEKIFPDLFLPGSEFPADLREHWRYPQDLFQIQSDQYLRYHITSPDTLFNGEDVWAIPLEVLQRDQTQPLEPYYVTLKLPDSTEPEFLLILPFTPRNRENAIAWLAGRSDGDNYGSLFAFRFPSGRNVAGPQQIESRIGQEPRISEQFTLLGQQGSEVIRGNLLFIPVGDSYVYVEALYVQAATSRFPQLKFVIVVNGDTIAFESTLAEAAAVALGFETTADFVNTVRPGDAVEEEEEPATAEAVVSEDDEPAAAEPAEDEPERPAPTTEPSDAPVSDDVGELIDDANQAFAQAQELFAAGDFAGYGEALRTLQRTLEALAALDVSAEVSG